MISLDGSFNGDATALLRLPAIVSVHPHMDVLGLWESPQQDDSYRVPILEVEQAIRDATKSYKVLEIVADPFRWARSPSSSNPRASRSWSSTRHRPG